MPYYFMFSIIILPGGEAKYLSKKFPPRWLEILICVLNAYTSGPWKTHSSRAVNRWWELVWLTTLSQSWWPRERPPTWNCREMPLGQKRRVGWPRPYLMACRGGDGHGEAGSTSHGVLWAPWENWGAWNWGATMPTPTWLVTRTSLPSPPSAKSVFLSL